jgi:hypothetical protein
LVSANPILLTPKEQTIMKLVTFIHGGQARLGAMRTDEHGEWIVDSIVLIQACRLTR